MGRANDSVTDKKDIFVCASTYAVLFVQASARALKYR
jgi:hypothetical protein